MKERWRSAAKRWRKWRSVGGVKGRWEVSRSVGGVKQCWRNEGVLLCDIIIRCLNIIGSHIEESYPKGVKERWRCERSVGGVKEELEVWRSGGALANL